MDLNVFSIFSLDNTLSAITELQNLLHCGLCNQKASDPICLGGCDHFFCSRCLESVKDATCPVCHIPSPPHARSNDNVVSGLLSSSEDLLKIFNGEKIQLDSQGLEAPWSTDLTKPYCSKTPKVIKVQQNKKDKCLEENKSNPVVRRNVKKLTVRNMAKHNKENCAKVNAPLVTTLLERTVEPSTPKHQPINKLQDLTPAINKRNDKGETSLHTCCIKGDLGKVKTLLVEGANPNTRDNAGWTPLHEASSHGYLDIAEILLKNGALVNVPGNNNETALHDSVSSSCLKMICLLRRWGADPNLKDIWGRTPRDLAAINSSQEVSEALLTPENSDLTSITKQLPVQPRITIMDSNLTPDYKKKLMQLSKLFKLRLVNEFCNELTHVVVTCDVNNICQRTVKYMTGIASGKTIISHKWIDACLGTKSIANFFDFEVVGTAASPDSKAPEKARKNTLQMNPNLFNGCHIYFLGVTNESSPCKKELEIFIKAGGGVHLHREPNPEAIGDAERTVPFHYRSSGRLAKCSHFCLYKDGDNEPLIKYDMPHLKSLPMSWLFNCVEQFEILDQ